MLYIFAKPTQGIRRLLERTRAQLYGKETVLRADDIVLRFGQSKLADPTEGLILNRQSALQLSRSKSQMAKFLRQVGVRFVLPSQNQPSANRFVRQFRIPVFNHQPLACFRTDGKEPWTNGRIQGMPQHEEEVALDSDRLITRAGWLAVRAVHALGLDAAYVSLGLGPKGVLHVIDVTSNPQLEGRLLEIYSEAIQTYMEQQITLSRFNYNQLKLGTDVELMLENAEGKMVLASRYFTRKGRVGCDDRSVQQDGRRLPLLELRPDPDQSPMGLYVNLRTTMLEAARRINRQDVAWRAGSMPFAGYSTGGHIHFSGFPFSSRLVRALDAYLGLPLMAVENPTRALGRRPRYGFLGDVRHKSYGGFEYRTPASFIVDPKVTLAAFALAHLIAVHYIELPEIWLYDPQVQSHFYSHEINELHPYLEQCMVAIRRLPAYRRYEEQIEPLFHMIEQQEIWDETVDVRDVWEIPKRFANTSSVPAVKRRRRKRVQSS
ncbi:putative amidoligase domain-containing protein [Alicyclobacillus tolerans]|uniref:Phage phiEco32-like COOH.NH2 ligase-type 2 n=2 Tax=Alicyclobacillus tolerans TaxID=90970 RepID=A0A1M6X6I9_9BACL|nr:MULTISPECIES: hypothetical protein [Alicyclobacillus]MDP9728925.1 hypothetical protein [Alicyclobacillus tengchongensis]SHL01435.1 Phage phiEco32-like COOH.NH2 ligase-type 2 [Alicyclobacillus montanus]